MTQRPQRKSLLVVGTFQYVQKECRFNLIQDYNAKRKKQKETQ